MRTLEKVRGGWFLGEGETKVFLLINDAVEGPFWNFHLGIWGVKFCSGVVCS